MTFEEFRDLSLATAIFTLRFLPHRHRLEVSRRLYEGLVTGGALVVAEKFYAKTPKIQDMLTSLPALQAAALFGSGNFGQRKIFAAHYETGTRG